jgi:hypothetical protein
MRKLKVHFPKQCGCVELPIVGFHRLQILLHRLKQRDGIQLFPVRRRLTGGPPTSNKKGGPHG